MSFQPGEASCIEKPVVPGVRMAIPAEATVAQRMLKAVQQATAIFRVCDAEVQTEDVVGSVSGAVQDNKQCDLALGVRALQAPPLYRVLKTLPIPNVLDQDLLQELQATRSPLQRGLHAASEPATRSLLADIASKPVGLCYHAPGTVAVVVHGRLISPRVMRDTGANTHLVSLGWVERERLPIIPHTHTVMTIAGQQAAVVGRLAESLPLVLAPAYPAQRVVQHLQRVLIMAGIDSICDVLVGTPADKDVLGYTHVGHSLYCYPPHLAAGDALTHVALPMHCDRTPAQSDKADGNLVVLMTHDSPHPQNMKSGVGAASDGGVNDASAAENTAKDACEDNIVEEMLQQATPNYDGEEENWCTPDLLARILFGTEGDADGNLGAASLSVNTGPSTMSTSAFVPAVGEAGDPTAAPSVEHIGMQTAIAAADAITPASSSAAVAAVERVAKPNAAEGGPSQPRVINPSHLPSPASYPPPVVPYWSDPLPKTLGVQQREDQAAEEEDLAKNNAVKMRPDAEALPSVVRRQRMEAQAAADTPEGKSYKANVEQHLLPAAYKLVSHHLGSQLLEMVAGSVTTAATTPASSTFVGVTAGSKEGQLKVTVLPMKESAPEQRDRQSSQRRNASKLPPTAERSSTTGQTSHAAAEAPTAKQQLQSREERVASERVQGERKHSRSRMRRREDSPVRGTSSRRDRVTRKESATAVEGQDRPARSSFSDAGDRKHPASGNFFDSGFSGGNFCDDGFSSGNVFGGGFPGGGFPGGGFHGGGFHGGRSQLNTPQPGCSLGPSFNGGAQPYGGHNNFASSQPNVFSGPGRALAARGGGGQRELDNRSILVPSGASIFISEQDWRFQYNHTTGSSSVVGGLHRPVHAGVKMYAHRGIVWHKLVLWWGDGVFPGMKERPGRPADAVVTQVSKPLFDLRDQQDLLRCHPVQAHPDLGHVFVDSGWWRVAPGPQQMDIGWVPSTSQPGVLDWDFMQAAQQFHTPPAAMTAQLLHGGQHTLCQPFNTIWDGFAARECWVQGYHDTTRIGQTVLEQRECITHGYRVYMLKKWPFYTPYTPPCIMSPAEKNAVAQREPHRVAVDEVTQQRYLVMADMTQDQDNNWHLYWDMPTSNPLAGRVVVQAEWPFPPFWALAPLGKDASVINNSSAGAAAASALR
jgi:hypothetical protein